MNGPKDRMTTVAVYFIHTATFMNPPSNSLFLSFLSLVSRLFFKP